MSNLRGNRKNFYKNAIKLRGKNKEKWKENQNLVAQTASEQDPGRSPSTILPEQFIGLFVRIFFEFVVFISRRVLVFYQDRLIIDIH